MAVVFAMHTRQAVARSLVTVPQQTRMMHALSPTYHRDVISTTTCSSGRDCNIIRFNSRHNSTKAASAHSNSSSTTIAATTTAPPPTTTAAAMAAAGVAATKPAARMADNPAFLDLAQWPRRPAFEFFKDFDNPFFNFSLRLDAAPLKAWLQARKAQQLQQQQQQQNTATETAAVPLPGTFSQACQFLVLRLANLHEAFRYRMEGGNVRVHEELHVGATVMRDDHTFGFTFLTHDTSFTRFAETSTATLAAARRSDTPFADQRVSSTAVVHMTTVPWVHFTSLAHARNYRREDSIPKFAFGRMEADGARLWLPFSIEVHHGVMDGKDAGHYVQALEAAFKNPQWLLD
jgi:chloramphenicol O-acetyltransferase type A